MALPPNRMSHVSSKSFGVCPRAKMPYMPSIAQWFGVNRPRPCNQSGIIKRGTIEPPIAEQSKTTKVETVFICAALLQRLAVKSPIEAARLAAPKQARVKPNI